jgi:acyl carrier protein
MYNEIEPGPTPATMEILPIEGVMRGARVRAIISNYVGQNLFQSVLEEADLDDLKIDALDRLGITCALDEAFLIEIPDADEEGWTTVGDVVATVARLDRAD